MSGIRALPLTRLDQPGFPGSPQHRVEHHPVGVAV